MQILHLRERLIKKISPHNYDRGYLKHETQAVDKFHPLTGDALAAKNARMFLYARRAEQGLPLFPTPRPI